SRLGVSGGLLARNISLTAFPMVNVSPAKAGAERRIVMSISRRSLLRHIGAGAIVGAAAPALRAFPLSPTMETTLWGTSTPVIQPGDAAVADPILLYRNENPYGPSEEVLAVMREFAASGNRYPRT